MVTNYYTGIGSRETPEHILDLMTKIAGKLENNNWILRSGGADGADSAFEAGVIGDKKEIWIPWKGFNGSSSTLFPSKESFEMAKKFHPAWDKCSNGAKMLHARNCHQVLGGDLNTPSKFIFCWTENGKLKGGTAQAIRIAMAFNVPICNFGSNEFDKQFGLISNIINSLSD